MKCVQESASNFALYSLVYCELNCELSQQLDNK